MIIITIILQLFPYSNRDYSFHCCYYQFSLDRYFVNNRPYSIVRYMYYYLYFISISSYIRINIFPSLFLSLCVYYEQEVIQSIFYPSKYIHPVSTVPIQSNATRSASLCLAPNRIPALKNPIYKIDSSFQYCILYHNHRNLIREGFRCCARREFVTSTDHVVRSPN